jgi:hypothetical protein
MVRVRRRWLPAHPLPPGGRLQGWSWDDVIRARAFFGVGHLAGTGSSGNPPRSYPASQDPVALHLGRGGDDGDGITSRVEPGLIQQRNVEKHDGASHGPEETPRDLRRPAGEQQHSGGQAPSGSAWIITRRVARLTRRPGRWPLGKQRADGQRGGLAGLVKTMHGASASQTGRPSSANISRRGRFAHADGAGEAKPKAHADSTACGSPRPPRAAGRTSVQSRGRPDAAACQARRRWCAPLLGLDQELGFQRGIDQVIARARAGSAVQRHGKSGLPVMPSEVVLTTVTASSSRFAACTHS